MAVSIQINRHHPPLLAISDRGEGDRIYDFLRTLGWEHDEVQADLLTVEEKKVVRRSDMTVATSARVAPAPAPALAGVNDDALASAEMGTAAPGGGAALTLTGAAAASPPAIDQPTEGQSDWRTHEERALVAANAHASGFEQVPRRIKWR